MLTVKCTHIFRTYKHTKFKLDLWLCSKQSGPWQNLDHSWLQEGEYVLPDVTKMSRRAVRGDIHLRIGVKHSSIVCPPLILPSKWEKPYLILLGHSPEMKTVKMAVCATVYLLLCWWTSVGVTARTFAAWTENMAHNMDVSGCFGD